MERLENPRSFKSLTPLMRSRPWSFKYAAGFPVTEITCCKKLAMDSPVHDTATEIATQLISLRVGGTALCSK